MTQAWTGGQYSVFRALFGGYLFVFFVQRWPFGADSLANGGLLLIGAAASLALLIGMRDRIAALVLLLFVSPALLILDLLTMNPGVVFVGCLLLFHVLLSAKPFGSWDVRGRLDPDSGWRMTTWIYRLAWIVLALGSAYGGMTKLASPSWIDGSALAGFLEDPLTRSTLFRGILQSMPSIVTHLATWAVLAAELLFVPLALRTRTRPWIWLVSLGIQIGSLALIDPMDLNTGMLLLHFFTFDPGWIAPRLPERKQGHTLVFYDGTCGLCHRMIRFLLAEDATGLRFRFAPLDSDRFRSASASAESGFEASDLIPDSVLVHRPGDAMLARSEGALEIGHQLGGLWRLMAVIVGWIPRVVLNAGYDFIARTRHRLFTRPDDACPILPAHLRDRFDP